MRWLKGILWVTAGLLLVSRVAPGLAAGGEIVLLDAPRGGWLASVRGDAPMVTVEEREGWRKVRVEGWMPIVAPGTPAPPAPPPGPPPAPQEQRPAAPGGVMLSGVLVPWPGQEPATPGVGLLVLLVDDQPAIGAEHQRIGDECKSSLAAQDLRIAALDAELRTSLNSNDNLRAATTRHDRAKADLAAARKERAALLAECRGRADRLFVESALARSISDGQGRYEFPDVAPGRYRVVAGERSGTAARGWMLSCNVEPGKSLVLDPRTGPAAADPYWGLK